jgi:hypothetical protein
MNIKVVDCKRNVVITVKIDLTEHMYIVVPEIIDHKFDYMKYRIMNIRKKYMNLYLENKKLYKQYEQELYNDIKEELINEMMYIHKTQGIMYYTM